MNDIFEKRVRAATVAGWWTLLIAVGFITLQWLIYLAVMSARPAWFLTMWGPETDWATMKRTQRYQERLMTVMAAIIHLPQE